MRGDGQVEARAKGLRKQLSPPELKLWMRLKGREPGQPAFRRQHAIGPYVADFYCAKARLVVEIDGWGHGAGDQPARDARRDGYMRRLGLRVERIWAGSVFADPDDVALGLKAMARAIARGQS